MWKLIVGLRKIHKKDNVQVIKIIIFLVYDLYVAYDYILQVYDDNRSRDCKFSDNTEWYATV